MKTVEKMDVLELLERAVNEKGPSYRPAGSLNAGCMYFTPGGSPICIVGHVFSYLGITESDLKITFEGAAPYSVPNSMKIGSVLPENVEFSPNALYILKLVQGWQDQGIDWDTSFERVKDL